MNNIDEFESFEYRTEKENAIYEKTINFGRTQFVREIALQIKENQYLKERVAYLERSNNRREETILYEREENLELSDKVDKLIEENKSLRARIKTIKRRRKKETQKKNKYKAIITELNKKKEALKDYQTDKADYIDAIEYLINTSDIIQENKREELLNYFRTLHKEIDILRANAIHNDKVVDSIWWENNILKRENQQLIADYGSQAQVERDMYRYVLDEYRRWLEFKAEDSWDLESCIYDEVLYKLNELEGKNDE